MKTSLIRQPFFYKKLGFFFYFYTCCQNFIWSFFPFYHIEIQFNIDTRWAGEVRPVQMVAFFQNRPTVCRSSGDHRLTLYRWESHEKRRIVQRKLLTWLFRQRNRRPTKASSKIGGNIGRQSTVSLQKTPLLIFAHRKSGRLSAWVNVNNRIINHVKCTEICS